jgi:hypothetical protein
MQFKPQKVLHLKDALALKTPKIHGEYIITEKFEGWDTTILFDGTKFLPVLSSANRPIPAFEWVESILNESSSGITVPFAIKAEAYLLDTPFEELNGIFNRSKGNYICKDVVFKIHDVIPLNCALIAKARLEFGEDIINYLAKPFLHKVPSLAVASYNKEAWERIFDEVAGRGGEGIVAKRLESFYAQGKRNADVLKLKLECTVETLAIALEEGIGEQGFPSLTLISQRTNGTKIRTVIGKHKDQDSFRANPANVIGKVVQLKAMSEYADGQLRQPCFQHIRYDKLPHEIN